MVQVEKRITELGLELPPAPKPVATYVPYVKVGNLLFISGQGPLVEGKPYITGKLGKEVSEEEGYKAAERAALNCIAIIKDAIGDLDKVERIVKVTGFVASAENFNRQPWVMNGASDLLVKIFGEKGKHSRSAIGVNELPLNIPVEVEMIVQIRED